MEPGFLAWFVQQAANHLWQSTAFAAVAFLVSVALRASHARARHWVWLAASVKFLVPFGVLASLGSVIGSWVVPAVPIARVPFTVQQVVQPFALPPQQAAPAVAAPAAGSAAFPVAAVLLSVWFIGFAAVLFHWWNRWHRVRDAVRASVPLREGREVDALRRLRSDVELVSSDARLEPGTFGILRPVLWLPAGIADRLSEAELDAILAHELCHARHRDNLWAAVHMAVEAIFWFHPLVWWLGARLVEERERACDEEVIRLGSEPQAYAEGVLKVCEFCIASALPCVPGISGANLKNRIEAIMLNRLGRRLGPGSKILLALAGILAIAGPVALGVLGVPQLRAERLTKFEVASVKPVKLGPGPFSMGMRGGPGSSTPELFTATNLTLMAIVMRAFDVPSFRLSGPSWLSAERFNIAAKVPPGSTKKDFQIMLQNLLAERFKLAAHRENKRAPIYALVVDKDGPRMKESRSAIASDGGSPQSSFVPTISKDGFPVIPAEQKGLWINFNGNHFLIQAHGVTTAGLAESLSGELNRPVLDETGLKIPYDFTLEFSPFQVHTASPEYAGGEVMPTIFSAVKQIGLKLEARKGAVEMLVIDHIEKMPTGN